MSRQGIEALQRGEVNQATALLRQAIATAPEDAEARRHLAEALWRRGEQTEAVSQIEAACQCGPQNTESAISAGEMRLAEGDAARATQWANHAISLDARSPHAWALRGRAHAQLDNSDRALADLLQALRLAPNDEQLLTNLAQIHQSRGDHARCLSTLHHLLDNKPAGRQSVEALAMAGESYLATGRPQAAADSLRLATSYDKSPDLLYKLAEVEAACGEPAQAAEDARRALEADAQHSPSRALLARLGAPDATSVIR